MSSSNPVRLTWQDDAGTALGRIGAAGFVEEGPAILPRPRRVLDSYALAFVHDGSGTYVDDKIPSREIAPGDLIFVSPGHPHWYGPPQGACWSEIFFVFDGPSFDTLSGAGVLQPDDPLRRVQPLQPWFERLHSFAAVQRGHERVERQLHVLELASLIVELRGDRQVSANPVPRPIRRAREMLASDLDAQLDLRAVAAAADLPYETFRKRFRASTGKSPQAFRLDRRIEAAQALLRNTGMTHSAIAATLGFADEQHFAKRFRARVGMSPRAYRRVNAGS
jgi:AraC-like DNA-binding protein